MINFSPVKYKKENSQGSIHIEEVNKKQIAVIGVGLKLPMAETVQDFWSILSNGKDCIREITEERKKLATMMLRACGVAQKDITFGEAAFIDDIDKFDYSYFNISPKEASVMDPNQRLFLETAVHAMEDAGYGADKLKGTRTGIFLGYGSELDYKNYVEKTEPESLMTSIPGNIKPVIASRLSYLMNFRGPSMLIDTTCSSSLVATHLACRSLRDGECETALAGGMRIHLMPYRAVKIGIESTDSRTHAFDDNSNGTGTGEGIVVMLLKPLYKAVEDKDHIYGVICGSAINHDGASQGLTAPNPVAQEDVIVRAWEDAKINPETISYIEAHGTGTRLGDPIEIDGLQRAFGNYTDRKSFCGIGSLKSNIGHLDNSAGSAGLLKGLLVLQKKQIPPTLHFQKPNHNIQFEDSPLYVADRLRDLQDKQSPLRSGVSSFGLSGTNCHIVLEEWKEKKSLSKESEQGSYIFTVSAKSETSFDAYVKEYIDFLTQNPDISAKSLSYTACTGRGQYDYRLAVLFSDSKELAAKLQKFLNSKKESNEEDKLFYGKVKSVRESDIKAIEDQNEEFYTAVCKKYAEGMKIDFDELWKDKRCQKISLPVYPFEKNKCWVNVKETNEEETVRKPFYKMTWCQEDLAENEDSEEKKNVLLFSTCVDGSSRMAEELRNRNMDVVSVETGTAWKEYSGSRHEIEGTKEDFTKIFEMYRDRRFDFVIFYDHNDHREDAADFEDRFKKVVNGSFYMAKALLESEIDYPLELIFMGYHVNEVSGSEQWLDPLPNSVFGLGKTLGGEYPNITSRALDLDEDTAYEDIVNELLSTKQYYLTAYRKGHRYVEMLEENKAEARDEDALAIQDEKVYVITGGTGGIGLEIASFLSSKAKIHLVFINRSAFPDRKEWDAILKNEAGSKYCYKINRIKAIEAGGSSVECCQADVSDRGQLDQCLTYVRQQYGKINGVIHGAGVAGRGYFMKKEEEEFLTVAAPKIKGTWLLDQLTRRDALDFMILFSSINTLAGIPGQTDYVTGNSYLDAYSAYRNKQGKKTIVINWTAWKETGMAYENHSTSEHSLMKAITTSDAIKLFEQILVYQPDRAIVGEFNEGGSLFGKNMNDIEFKVSEQIAVKLGLKEGNEASEQTFRKQTDANMTRLDYPQIEASVTEIWKKVLGYEEIDINSNFFAIGGDSIMINQVDALLNEAFPDMISVIELFKYTTIASISKYIYQKQSAATEEPEKKTENDSDADDQEAKNKIAQMLLNAKENNIDLDKAMEEYLSMED